LSHPGRFVVPILTDGLRLAGARPAGPMRLGRRGGHGVRRPRRWIARPARGAAKWGQAGLRLGWWCGPTARSARDGPAVGMGRAAGVSPGRGAVVRFESWGRRRKQSVGELKERGRYVGWTKREHVFVKVPGSADGPGVGVSRVGDVA
jgi:hypothetical protein